MAGNTVLLTGASGFVGFRVLRYTLEHGYNVRAAVRSEAKAEAVRSNPVLKALGKDAQLSFVIVPDFIAPGAFDEAVKGVEGIIHVASPLPSKTPNDGDMEKLLIEPAVRGTIAMFESARKVDSVRRIVVTSSVVAIAPVRATFVESVDETFGPESRVSEMHPPIPNAQIYIASKVATLNRAEAWVKREKPTFDVNHVIYIEPAEILGRDDYCLSTADVYGGAVTNTELLDEPLIFRLVVYVDALASPRHYLKPLTTMKERPAVRHSDLLLCRVESFLITELAVSLDDCHYISRRRDSNSYPYIILELTVARVKASRIVLSVTLSDRI
ncbi:hypothetical protein LTR08_004704 [Meristemomyces frigidus]|nr:hypothetical protein LTR08_004704 [Meristemomyces frigidus]